MAILRTIDALTETPAPLLSVVSNLHTLSLYNPDAIASVYFKIYVGANLPNPAANTPHYEFRVFPGAGMAGYAGPFVLSDLDAELPPCWAVATASTGADATAPASPLSVVYTYRPL